MPLGMLAPGEVFYLYDSSSSRRSTHIVQREQDRIPTIITSSEDVGLLSTQEILAPHILNVYPPSPTGPESSSRPNTAKEFPEGHELADQVTPRASVDSSHTALRVVYSPAVSRSSSVTQADQPTILLSQPEPSDDIQIIPSDSLQSGSRIRSNSFEARATSDGILHRRNLSRNNSSELNNDGGTLSVQDTAPAAQPAILGSSNRHRRLTIEEVAEESDNNHGNVSVFTAFPPKRWLDSVMVAKVVLAFVITAVLGNLIYT